MPGRLAQALLAVAAVVGALSLIRMEGEVRDARAGNARITESQGVPSLAGMPLGTATIRRDLPSDERVRVVTLAGPCQRVPIGQGQGAVYWLQYQLLPRSISCEADVRWTIYLKVPPPPGERRVATWPEISLTRR
jgi:hypothetical protein